MTPGFTRACALRFKDIHFVEQAVRLVEATDAYRYQFYWVSHWERVGGGEPVAAGAELLLSSDFRPLSYEVFSDRMPLRRAVFSGTAVECELGDGSRHVTDLGAPADFVFQHNVVAQLALFLAGRGGAAEPVTARFFSPESLSLHEIQASRDGEVWHTSLGIDLRLDAEGGLADMRMAKAPAEPAAEPIDLAFPEGGLAPLREPRQQPAPPPPPAGMSWEEIDIPSEDGTIGAVVLRPAGAEGPLPACLFLPGSGPIDRYGRAPGLDLGSHAILGAIAGAGMAAVSIDARGSGRTAFGDLSRGPVTSRRRDGEAALRWLASGSVAGGRPLTVVGHSLGALVAMCLLSEADAPPVAGAALLAPPGRGLGRIIAEQAVRETNRLQLDAQAAARRRKGVADWLRKARRNELEDGKAPALLNSVAALARPDALRLAPRRLVAAMPCPLLICQGSKDIQTSLEKDAVALFQAAAGAGRAAELRLFANLDHLFREEPGVPAPAEYFKPKPIGGAFLESLATWLSRRSGLAD